MCHHLCKVKIESQKERIMNLTFNIMNTKKKLRALALASVVFISGCTNDVGIDVNLPPKVNKTAPAKNETNVSLSAIITATFSTNMNPSTINSSTFTLKDDKTEIVGKVTYLDAIASFKSDRLLKQNTIYIGTITTGAKDLIGNTLASTYVFSFKTLKVIDNILPIIKSTYPLANDINVGQNKLIAINFSEEMNATTINATTFTLKQGNVAVAGVVGYSGTTATFKPTNVMSAGTVYTALITTGAKDLAGNSIAADKQWSFTTEAAPLINSVSPLSGAIDVVRNTSVSVNFNKSMNASTINATTFTLKQGNVNVDGSVSYSGTTATFTPTNVLAAGTVYTALTTVGVKDLAGNTLAAAKQWSFTTKNTTTGLAIVNLKTSGNYVILAKTAINNNPTSNITGDLGLSPAATSYITGFSLTDFTGYATSAQVTGKVFAADMVTPTSGNLTTAVEDMILAYNDAAGRPTPDFLNLGTGNLGGKTLAPGLYKFTSSVTLPANVTLSGGANDVWIFQISGDLSMSANVKVTLSGGAQAKNIFWQVAGEATFGATSHFEGIILSWTGITFQTSATFKGRALAGTAVILDANTVVGPN